MSVFSVHSWKTIGDLSQGVILDHVDKYDTKVDNPEVSVDKLEVYPSNNEQKLDPGEVKNDDHLVFHTPNDTGQDDSKILHEILTKNKTDSITNVVENNFQVNRISAFKDNARLTSHENENERSNVEHFSKFIELDEDFDEGLGDLDAIFDDFDELYEATINSPDGPVLLLEETCRDRSESLLDDTGSDRASSETDSVLGSPFSPSDSVGDPLVSPFWSKTDGTSDNQGASNTDSNTDDDYQSVEDALKELKALDLSNSISINVYNQSHIRMLSVPDQSELLCNKNEASVCDSSHSSIKLDKQIDQGDICTTKKKIKTCMKSDKDTNLCSGDRNDKVRSRFLSLPAAPGSTESDNSGKLSPTTKAKSVHFAIFPYVIEIPRVADIEQEYGESEDNHKARQKSHVPSSYSSSRISPADHPSRNRTRLGTSQSQPSSRSSSPTPRHSYITHTSGHAAPLTPSRPRKSSSTAARSQGTSREGSPSRSIKSSGYGLPGRERRMSGGKTKMGINSKTLRPGQDTEELLADALRQPLRKRYESYDSDDNASETSSVCSERSYSSYGKTSEGSEGDKWPRRLPTPTAKDMGEILGLLQSNSYQDRKEGLICLQKLLRQNRYLTRIELKKATEIFNRMFHDPHSKVFSLFLEMLIDLIHLHSRDLGDWLFIILSRLLNKMGSDILGSLQAKVQRALDATRENFPSDLQFNIMTRFMIDQTQSPSLKVKQAMLNYLIGLVPCMENSDFSNSGDTRLVLSRLITWTNEPKNQEIRKASQTVLIALFNLNPSEFTMMLSGLPKAFQDGATRMLTNHLQRNSEQHEVLTPRNTASPTTPQNRSRPPSRGPYQRDEADTENMNPEDIYNSIKKTSADIQNLSFNSKLDQFDDVKKRKEFTSQDSGIQDLRNDSPDAGDTRKPAYNPSQYQDDGSINGYNNKTAMAEAVFDVENEISFNEGSLDQDDMISDILRELSNHNQRNEERKNTMLQLIKLTQDGTFSLWEEHFKSILLIILETLGDDDLHVRSMALRVLREILRKQSQRFADYAELTMLRILEAHTDPAKENPDLYDELTSSGEHTEHVCQWCWVVRAAEECAATLASYIVPVQSIKILIPIVDTAKYPINLAAIKMMTRVVEQMSGLELTPTLPEAVPALLKGYDNSNAIVRKASCFCLVAIYMVVGEDLRKYLADLCVSKVKLLNLYIKRAQAEKESGKVMSPHSSDTS